MDSWHTLSGPYPVFYGLNKTPLVQCTRCMGEWTMDDEISVAVESEEDLEVIVHGPCKRNDMDI